MTTERFNREGEPMRALGYMGDGPDFEVYHSASGFRWDAFSGERLMESGTARTRVGLALGLLRARRRLRRQIAKEAR